MNKSYRDRLAALEALEAEQAQLSAFPAEQYAQIADQLYWRGQFGVRVDQPRDHQLRLFLGVDPSYQPVVDWVNTEWQQHRRAFIPLSADELQQALAMLNGELISAHPARLDYHGSRAQGDDRIAYSLACDLDHVLFVHLFQTGQRPADSAALRVWLVEVLQCDNLRSA